MSTAESENEDLVFLGLDRLRFLGGDDRSMADSEPPGRKNEHYVKFENVV